MFNTISECVITYSLSMKPNIKKLHCMCGIINTPQVPKN